MDELSAGMDYEDERFDEDDEWATDFDDDDEGLDSFDLGVYAGAWR